MKSYRKKISSQYGSRRGFLRTNGYRVLNQFGFYKQLRKVEWSNVERLVFVCKGNICRSAFAEMVAHSYGVDAISCGVDTIENAPANPDAIKMATHHGFDLIQHRTQSIKCVELRETDLLVAMEPWHISVLKEKLSYKYQYSFTRFMGFKCHAAH